MKDKNLVIQIPLLYYYDTAYQWHSLLILIQWGIEVVEMSWFALTLSYLQLWTEA